MDPERLGAQIQGVDLLDDSLGTARFGGRDEQGNVFAGLKRDGKGRGLLKPAANGPALEWVLDPPDREVGLLIPIDSENLDRMAAVVSQRPLGGARGTGRSE